MVPDRPFHIMLLVAKRGIEARCHRGYVGPMYSYLVKEGAGRYTDPNLTNIEQLFKQQFN